jgi:hypothetical protein
MEKDKFLSFDGTNQLFAEEVEVGQYTKEQITNAMHQVELEDDKDYSKLFYRVLQKLSEF